MTNISDLLSYFHTFPLFSHSIHFHGDGEHRLKLGGYLLVGIEDTGSEHVVYHEIVVLSATPMTPQHFELLKQESDRMGLKPFPPRIDPPSVIAPGAAATKAGWSGGVPGKVGVNQESCAGTSGPVIFPGDDGHPGEDGTTIASSDWWEKNYRPLAEGVERIMGRLLQVQEQIDVLSNREVDATVREQRDRLQELLKEGVVETFGATALKYKRSGESWAGRACNYLRELGVK